MVGRGAEARCRDRQGRARAPVPVEGARARADGRLRREARVVAEAAHVADGVGGALAAAEAARLRGEARRAGGGEVRAARNRSEVFLGLLAVCQVVRLVVLAHQRIVDRVRERGRRRPRLCTRRRDVVVGDEVVRQEDVIRDVSVRVRGDVVSLVPRVADRVVREDPDRLARLPAATGEMDGGARRVVGLVARDRGRGRNGRGRCGCRRRCGVGRGCRIARRRRVGRGRRVRRRVACRRRVGCLRRCVPAGEADHAKRSRRHRAGAEKHDDRQQVLRPPQCFRQVFAPPAHLEDPLSRADRASPSRRGPPRWLSQARPAYLSADW